MKQQATRFSALPNRRNALIAIGLLIGGLALFGIYYVVPLWKLGCIDSAIVTMRTLIGEEQEFSKQHPVQGYGCQLSDFQSSEMLRKLAHTGRRNGYAFEIACPPGRESGVQRTFQLTARPLISRVPAYCADQSGVLWYDERGSSTRCLLAKIPLGN
jgi:hypothetical protein